MPAQTTVVLTVLFLTVLVKLYCCQKHYFEKINTA